MNEAKITLHSTLKIRREIALFGELVKVDREVKLTAGGKKFHTLATLSIKMLRRVKETKYNIKVMHKVMKLKRKKTIYEWYMHI